MRHPKIRWKLTLWYGVVLAVVVAAFGTSVYLIMRHQQMQRVELGLQEELSDVLNEIHRANAADSLNEWLNRRFAKHPGFDFQITDRNGERFFHSERLTATAWPPPQRNADSTVATFETVPVDAMGNWRVVHVLVDGPAGPLTVQVGRSLVQFEHESKELLATLLIAGSLSFLAASGGGYFLAARLLRPVQTITQTARSISADRLDSRIPVLEPDDELGELATTMNEMLDRLGRSITEMQRFTADAAHELRTPLAIIRNEAEVALRQPRSTIEYCSVIENLLEETNRLSSLAEKLLFLSRQDAGTARVVREAVAIDELLSDIVSHFQIVAAERGITLTTSLHASCQIRSDAQLVRRVVINVLDNAIKYNVAVGRIEVSSRMVSGGVEIRFADSGVGISPEHLPQIFDRFFRGDASRNGEAGGSGLGLSICQAIVRSLNGTITVESEVGQGTTVTVTLPSNATDADVDEK